MKTEQLIVALGREFGSGGREIARKLAERLQISLYDRNLLETIAVLTASCIIFSTHLSNFKMAKRREDVVNTTDFVEKVFGKKK